MMQKTPPDQGLQNATKKLQQYNKVSKLYDKIRVLGRGSFGTASVYRRRKDRLLVVLKEIDLLKFKGDQERLSTVNEVEIMSSLDHPNIIKYYNAFATDTKLIIEMEYANFGTLATYLNLQGPLELSEILIIFKQLTRGLSYLHSKSIIHLDLKMENIFLTNDGLVKIGDFGIAKHLNQKQQQQNSGLDRGNKFNNDISEQVSSDANNNNNNNISDNNNNDNSCYDNKNDNGGIPSSACFGNNSIASPFQCTLAYSSPERCLGEPSDFKSDIWSLGCILYELITSKPLFSATSIAQLVIHITQILYNPIERPIPDNLKALFELMIMRNPLDRPPAQEIQMITSQIATDISGQQSRTSSTMNNHNNIHNNYINTNNRLSSKRRMSSAGQLEGAAANRRLQLLSILGANQQHQKQQQNQHQQQQFANCISSDLNQPVSGSQFADEQLNQLLYPHSLLYQLSLDGPNVTLGRIGLPQSKRIRDIVGGKSHFLALTYDNIIFGWGSRDHGQLGSCYTNSTTKPAYMPQKTQSNCMENTIAQSNNQKVTQNLNTKPIVAISELNHTKIIQIAAGKNFSVFLSKTGIVLTCGDATFGCLGHGNNTSNCFKPRMVESLLNKDVVYIAASSKHVIAICGNGHVYAWGLSKGGRLGVSKPSSVIINEPQRVNFPPNIKIIAAFCGTKSTIFLDSDRHCWACGDNSYNKLGLDVIRRFKRTKIIESTNEPVAVDSLSKICVKSISISKDHSIFIANDGRLWILGRDLNHAFELDSYRQTEARSFEHHFLSTLANSSTTQQHQQPTDNFLNQAKLETIQTTASTAKSLRNIFSKQSTKWKARDLELHMKNCRSLRKLPPFELVQSVATSCQFSLALTNDNRVYFWGTRSYKQVQIDSSECVNLSHKNVNLKLNEQNNGNILIDCKKDDCFVKIAHTNKSVMQSMQHFGSDQPIMHVQDPRLIIKDMSDLWVLDYQSVQLSNESDPNSSSNSNLSSSSISLDDNFLETNSILNSDKISSLKKTQSLKVESSKTGRNLEVPSDDCASSCCSQCTDNNCCSSCDGHDNSSSSCHSSSSHDLQLNKCRRLVARECLPENDQKCPSKFTRLNNYKTKKWKHDVILEPQPIISLYVPPTSLFNQQANSLRIAKIHCFNKDNFYLVLETTYKNTSTTTLTSTGSNSKFNTNTTKITTNQLSSNSKIFPNKQQAGFNTTISSKPIDCELYQEDHFVKCRSRRPSLPIELDRSPNEPNRFMSRALVGIKSGIKQVSSVVGSADEAIKLANVVIVANASNSIAENDSLSAGGNCQSNVEGNGIIIIKAGDNNNLHNENSLNHSNLSSDNQRNSLLIVNEDEATISSGNQTETGENKPAASSLGMSLDEPRSLSTFAQSDSTQIVIGPSKLSGCGVGGGDMRFIDPRNGIIVDRNSTSNQRHFLGAFSRLRRRANYKKNGNKFSNSSRKTLVESQKFESPNTNEITEDTTTSMPSWICNEYLEHKQRLELQQTHPTMQLDQTQQDQLQSNNNDTIFKIDSSSDTRTSEISNENSDMTQIGFDVDRNDILMCPDSNHNFDYGGTIGKQTMLLTCDIPEVLRPRAKSFGESSINRVYDQQSDQQNHQQRPLHQVRNKSKNKINSNNIIANHDHISNKNTDSKETSLQTSRRHRRPRSLNASQQFPSDFITTNWLPSGGSFQNFNDLSTRPNLDQLMRDSQSSSRALTEITLSEQQQRYNKTTSSQNGGSNLSLASLRNSIIKLFR